MSCRAGLWPPRRMSISRRAASEKLRGRLCQEETPVLAEQFSSMEHDGFRVPYLSANIRKPHLIDKAVDRAAGTCGARPHPRGPLALGADDRGRSERGAPGREPWSLSSTVGLSLDSRGAGRPSPSGGAWAGRAAVQRSSSDDPPRRTLTVYFCTNVVGTLDAEAGLLRAGEPGLVEAPREVWEAARRPGPPPGGRGPRRLRRGGRARGA